MRFAGKTVVITGAAGVYGRELSAAFAAEGARLVLVDLDGPALEAFAATLKLPSERLALFAGDLTDDAVSARLVAETVARRCPDVVVNNAAVYPFVALMDVSSEQFRRQIATNVRVPFQLMQGFGRAMIAAGVKGAFVNVSSAAAEVIRQNGVVYGASKCALEYVSRAFAIEFGPHGIRVNCARPAFAEGSAHVQMPPGYGDIVAARSLLRRRIRPGEFAQAVMFLASDAAGFVTGSVLDSNGGGAINRREGAATAAGG